MPKTPMLKALAIKELRESAAIVALGLLASIYIVGPLMGVSVGPWRYARDLWYPFVNQLHLEEQGLVLGGLAFVLGLKQTAWEIQQGTFRFLLHRPLAREKVFWLKLAIGCAAVLLSNAFLILIYAWWADRPGNHPSPFYWSMTAESWKVGGSLVLVYLSGFLCGLRPGNWFGTRFLPVVIGIGAAFAIYYTPWWWLELAIAVAAATVLLTAINYYVQARDY